MLEPEASFVVEKVNNGMIAGSSWVIEVLYMMHSTAECKGASSMGVEVMREAR